jgi:hypothetical protein
VIEISGTSFVDLVIFTGPFMTAYYEAQDVNPAVGQIIFDVVDPNLVIESDFVVEIVMVNA